MELVEKEFVFPRSMELDLSFSGVCLASVDDKVSADSKNYSEVIICRTSSGRFVAAINTYSDMWDTENYADSFNSAIKLVDFLRDEDDKLPPLHKKALTAAALHDDRIRSAIIERID